MKKSYICAYSSIIRYGAWSAWPFYEDTLARIGFGIWPEKPAYVEYHKNGRCFRKISGRWVETTSGRFMC